MAHRTKSDLAVLREKGEVAACLYLSLCNGDSALHQVPGLIKRCIKENCWQKRYVSQIDRLLVCKHFEEFITASPPTGLGSDLRTVRNLCQDDPEALDLIDQVMQKRRGAPLLNQNASQDKTNGVNHPICFERDRSSKLLRRLRKDFPELHVDVLAGLKTATRAAVEAGIYPPRLTIRLDDAEMAARAIRQAVERGDATCEYLARLQLLLSLE